MKMVKKRLGKVDWADIGPIAHALFVGMIISIISFILTLDFELSIFLGFVTFVIVFMLTLWESRRMSQKELDNGRKTKK